MSTTDELLQDVLDGINTIEQTGIAITAMADTLTNMYTESGGIIVGGPDAADTIIPCTNGNADTFFATNKYRKAWSIVLEADKTAYIASACKQLEKFRFNLDTITVGVLTEAQCTEAVLLAIEMSDEYVARRSLQLNGVASFRMGVNQSETYDSKKQYVKGVHLETFHIIKPYLNRLVDYVTDSSQVGLI